MRLLTRYILPALAVALSGCERSTAVTGPSRLVPGAPDFNRVAASATGGGHYLLAGLYDVRFSFSAVQQEDGSAHGQFSQVTEMPDGTVDISGEVTCLAVDPVNGRAWIGGVVKQNNSTNPAYQVPITQPGQDVWFRVLDSGEGAGSPADRSTFLGFVGVIPSSAAYCALRIWPAGNARTHPVTEGNIQVH